MIKKIILGVLLSSGVAFADMGVPAKEFAWPKTPVRFRVVTIPVDLEWKEGRPFASRDDLVSALHLPPEGPRSVDLIEALAEKGWNVRFDRNGDIEAINPKGVSRGSGMASSKTPAPKKTPGAKPNTSSSSTAGKSVQNSGANYNQNPYQPR